MELELALQWHLIDDHMRVTGEALRLVRAEPD